MTFLAYGEDALTLYTLLERRSDLLRELDDDTDPEAATVIFRPSFGRRGAGGEGVTARATPSAQFGEFDAILGTARATYLVESKWERSGEAHSESLALRYEQVRRHEVMRWYIQEWRRLQPSDWPEFATSRAEAFLAAFPGMRLAPARSALAQNLEFLLRRLQPAGATVRDVLLFVCGPEFSSPTSVTPAEFEVVCIRHPAVGGVGFIEISRR
jgi:hypothetical protein